MARTASGRLALELRVTESNTDVGVGDSIGRVDHILTFARDLVNGTANGEIDRVYSTSGTASTSPTSIDLSGSLASVVGAGAVVFVEIQAIALLNTGSTQLRMGGVANMIGNMAASSDILLIPAGGAYYHDFGTAGLTVTGASTDILNLDTAASTTTYKLIVIGRSA